MNSLNSVWWHKNVTKNRKLYIYQIIIQSILVYGAEVCLIPTREINEILSTEMDVLRRSARKSRMERIKKWIYKGNNGSEMEAGHHRHHTAEKTTVVWSCQKDARGENTEMNYGLDTTGDDEKRTSKKNVDGRSTSSHDNKKFRTRSMEKQRRMPFGFCRTATAVKKRIDRLD